MNKEELKVIIKECLNEMSIEELYETIAESKLEVLDEACNLYYTNDFCATLDSEEHYGDSFWKDPYIKVYDGSSYSKAKNCIRVYLKDGKCVHHTDNKGGLPFNSKGWKEFLNYIMDKNSSKYPSLTVYDAIYFEIRNIFGLSEEEQKPYIFKKINFVTDTYWGGGKVRAERR